jgi:hypothetical protein
LKRSRSAEEAGLGRDRLGSSTQGGGKGEPRT